MRTWALKSTPWTLALLPSLLSPVTLNMLMNMFPVPHLESRDSGNIYFTGLLWSLRLQSMVHSKCPINMSWDFAEAEKCELEQNYTFYLTLSLGKNFLNWEKQKWCRFALRGQKSPMKELLELKCAIRKPYFWWSVESSVQQATCEMK